MHRVSCRWFVLGLLLCAGCSGSEVLKTEYVEGVVTLDGTPVAEATVTFRPVTPGQGLPAAGTTDQNGVYTLTAQPSGGAVAKAGAGTLPGEYFVAVAKIESTDTRTDEEIEESSVPYGQEPSLRFVVPRRYNDPRESGLKATVQGGQNNIPLELTSNP